MADGYGHARYEGRQIAAHRLALGYSLGRQLAAAELACHHCDNRPCCNPKHLFVGTAYDNNLDMTRKGRRRSGVTRHYLTDAEKSAVRQLRMDGMKATDVAVRFGVHRETVRRLQRQQDGTFVPARRFAPKDFTRSAA